MASTTSGCPTRPRRATPSRAARCATTTTARCIIERLNSEPVGTVQYRAVHYGPPPDLRAWNIGIEIRPAARGHGLGADAQRLLADWLFAATDAYRVEAQTDIENAPEQRSLEKAGFVREGVNRGAQFRAGEYHDLVMYSQAALGLISRS